MNRSARRHRSTKVPNVKLRPAPSKAGGGRNGLFEDEGEEDERAEQEAMQHYQNLRVSHAAGKRKADEHSDKEKGEDEEEEEEEEEEAEEDDCEPLAGCTICTTGFEAEKVKLHECVVALGATLEGNLTEAATHLIAKEGGSDKYYWAIKLGMPVMKPSWLYDLRERWQKAEPIQFEELLEEHRLDAFQGLTLAMAGVTDVKRRQQIRSAVKGASGQTPTVFTLDGSFTHLLCEDVKDSQTLKAVEKYLYKANRYHRRGEEVPDDARNVEEIRAAMKLKMVWVDWVEDCLQVNGCIEERLYSIHEPRMTVEQRAKLVNSILARRAERQRRTAESLQRSHAARKGEAGHAGQLQQGQGKTAPATKRAKVGLGNLAQNIALGIEQTKEAQASSATALPGVVEPNIKFPSDSNPAYPRTSTSLSIPARRDVADEAMDKASTVQEDDESIRDDYKYTERSLKQISFRIDLRDESKNKKVFEALRSYGIVNLLRPEDEGSADFHVLPLAGVEPFEGKHVGQPVTHFFIERCMMEDRVIGLNESFALQPSRHSFPISDVNGLHVALTGFGSNETGPDRHQMEMALNAAGIKFESVFRRGVHTHLMVGKSAAGSHSSDAKIERAQKWGVPVVGIEFIDEIFRTGKVPTASNERVSKSTEVRVADDAGDATMDRSTTLMETQMMEVIDVSRDDLHTNKENVSQGKGAPEQGFSARQRPAEVEESKLVSKKLVERHSALNEAKSSRPNKVSDDDVMASSLQQAETQFKQSLIGTQVYRTSSDLVMDFLMPNGASSTAKSVQGSTSGAHGRKMRRLPPSMRDRIRHSSRTPTVDDRATSVTSDLSDAEQLLSKNQQNEEEQLLLQQESLQNGLAEDAQNERVVYYDDPAARRERRRIAAMIGRSIERQKDDAASDTNDSSPEKPKDIKIRSDKTLPQQHIKPSSVQSSPSKQRSATVARISPTIKARRQPGTANRDA